MIIAGYALRGLIMIVIGITECYIVQLYCQSPINHVWSLMFKNLKPFHDSPIKLTIAKCLEINPAGRQTATSRVNVKGITAFTRTRVKDLFTCLVYVSLE